MPDREKVMSWLEGLAESDWRECYSDSEVQETARQALDLIDELLKINGLNIDTIYDNFIEQRGFIDFNTISK